MKSKSWEISGEKDENRTIASPVAIAIFTACTLGWSMSNFFPFEVAGMPLEEAQNDPGLIQVETSNKPEWLQIFVEKSIIPDLIDPMILDYSLLNEVEFPFVVINPQLIDDLQFYGNVSLEQEWSFDRNSSINKENQRERQANGCSFFSISKLQNRKMLIYYPNKE